MPMYPEEVLQEILQRTDLVQLIGEHVALRRSGRRYVGLCPFHQEKTPSFSVDADKQMFYCFGCQTGGTAFTFMQKRENLSFGEAVELLAERSGVSLPASNDSSADDSQMRLKRRLYDACEAALQYYRQQLKTHPEAGRARRYAIKRQLDEVTIERFQLGYAPAVWRGLAEYLQVNGFGLDILEAAGLVVRQSEQTYYDRFRDRLIFPIFDFRGRCIAFGGRLLDNEPNQPKYLNSPQSPIFDKSHTLYGIHLHKGAKPAELVVYEGYMDLVSTWQAGCHDGVASLGTALTVEHCRLLKRYTDKVILCYDADNAGQAATERGMFLLRQAGLEVRVAQIPQGKDPDEYVRLHGGDLYRDQVLASALPLLRYCKESLKKGFDIQSIEGKSSYVREFLIVLAKIATPIEEEEYLHEIAAELKLTPEAIRREQKAIQRSTVGRSSLSAAAISGHSSRQEGTLLHGVEQEAAKKTTLNTGISGSSGVKAGTEGDIAVAAGRLRAEENLLALALADVRYAVKLTESFTADQFAGRQHRILANEFWDCFRSQLPVGEIQEHDPALASLVARLSFLESALIEERELAFAESSAYLQADILRDQLTALGERCQELQQSGDDAALMETVQKMQELQRQLAAMRGR